MGFRPFLTALPTSTPLGLMDWLTGTETIVPSEKRVRCGLMSEILQRFGILSCLRSSMMVCQNVINRTVSIQSEALGFGTVDQNNDSGCV